ncbi:unnamed protein product [Zymoseptoria tritici ST99CH_3D7]|uniref:Uncharacterized protein n=1 Tax=Zymoseptoria tritici (strain ST99CH_3D7) TaxID=1276538 RepID=A0A1X7RX49_ZYMT9|nr:unnamed protein product [Zymoseptoria tritici ST99CH_3D7]
MRLMRGVADRASLDLLVLLESDFVTRSATGGNLDVDLEFGCPKPPAVNQFANFIYASLRLIRLTPEIGSHWRPNQRTSFVRESCLARREVLVASTATPQYSTTHLNPRMRRRWPVYCPR